MKKDPTPGRPKILFIGLADSSHTHSWINLLNDAEFEVRLFASPGSGLPPENWPVTTYLPSYTSDDVDILKKNKLKLNRLVLAWRKLKNIYLNGLTIHPDSDSILRIFLVSLIFLSFLPVRILSKLSGRKEYKNPGQVDSFVGQSLANVIKTWQPDIIHTLGVFDDQGGEFYFAARKKYHLKNMGVWVAQLRGGSDLTLRRHDPKIVPIISEILSESQIILSDNLVNIEYAEQLGIPRGKFASIVPVPGTGGIDVEEMVSAAKSLPSTRRIILVPKAYESLWSKASPIFEGLRLAWERLQQFEIVFLAVNPEARTYYLTLPSYIREKCRIEGRLPRNEVLNLMRNSRVMLAPSLVDGVPNVMYEAMANGVFPIVSPLDTILPLVKDGENVLFARNLYPEEIAAKLVRAVQDDELVDRAASLNLELVRRVANRKKIKLEVSNFYATLSKPGNKSSGRL